MKKLSLSWLLTLSLGLLATSALAADVRWPRRRASVQALTTASWRSRQDRGHPGRPRLRQVCLTQCAERSSISSTMRRIRPASSRSRTSSLAGRVHHRESAGAPAPDSGERAASADHDPLLPDRARCGGRNFHDHGRRSGAAPNPRLVTLTGTGNRPPVCNANGPTRGTSASDQLQRGGSSDPTAARSPTRGLR